MTSTESARLLLESLGDTPEKVVEALSGWFSWAKWSAGTSGGYCCVWAKVETGRVGIAGFVFDRSSASVRAARSRSWGSALQSAKRWAWSQEGQSLAAEARHSSFDAGRLPELEEK